MKKFLKRYGFTLVELIVVIVILAVLAALAFMMVSKWIGSSKDSRRKTDLAVVSNGMSLYIADHIIYPDPDNMKPVKDSVGGTGWYQGELGDTVKDFISGLKKTPKDPSGENYGYSITTDKKKYQLRAITENQEKIGYIGDNLYAATYYGYIKGNYDGYVIILTGGTYNFYQIPSLFINDTDLTESYRLSTGLQPIIQNNKPITDKFDVKKVDVSTMFNGGDYTSALNLITTSMTGYGSIDEQTAYRIVKEAPGTNPTLFSAIPPAAELGSSSSSVSVSGECGASNNTTVGTIPTTNLCSVGTTGSVSTYSTGWTWSCAGANGGSTANCSAIKAGTYCNYTYSADTYHTDWNISTELGYHDNKCYIFGDEDVTAIAACNKWTTDNATLGGAWVWTPARWFVSDGYGTNLKDSFYQREVTYNGNSYVCRGFAVMKYEAKFTSTTGKTQPDATWKAWAVNDYTTDNDTFPETLAGGGIISKAEDYPVGHIRQGEAIDACGTAGTYHLITNNEWMAISRNIEQQGGNWTSGIKGSGGIYRGNVNLSDNMSWSSYTSHSSRTYSAGNDTDPRGIGVIGNRWHILSNGLKLWDISGNVWEHVNKSNLPNTSNLRSTNIWNSSTDRISNACGGSNWYSFYNNDGVEQCGYTNSYTYANIGPATINLNSNNGIGRIYSYSTASNIFRRGGNGGNEVIAGVFALNLNLAATDLHNGVGLRCVR